MDIVSIQDDEIGIVESIAGAPCEVGRIFGTPVDCDSYQDAQAFLVNGGQKGPQIAILPPGSFRINGLLFHVEIKTQTKIQGGKIGLVTAMDGARVPEGRLLAAKVDGHSNFEKGDVFMKNGGEKGRQIDVLMPGVYRINTALFEVDSNVDQVEIGSDEVGIVTVYEGEPIMKANQIAADELDLNIHNNFQDPAAFLKANGQKGLQIPILRSGRYAINTWFAQVKNVSMVNVQIGECAVVTNFVGEEGEDVTSEDVNAKIVQNGKKGIWADPLGPGKHPLNTMICKVDIVPTTQILLNWADNESSAHKFDSNLKTITLRTADAFNVNMDVSVIIHIAMKDAPKVIANLGSVSNMISQVLEPAISSHFRNSAQSVKALDLYTKRSEIQSDAKKHIQDVLKGHHIESKDTMIADVVLPIELTKTVTDRQIAEQETVTYNTQKKAQNERRELENATAQANMQPKVVESERNVEISNNIAQGKVKEADGLKQAAILAATGKAEARKLEASAEAEATKVTAEANSKATILNADANKHKGLAEAAVILEQGKSTAEAYKLEVEAMGQENFGRIKSLEQIKDMKLKLVPDTLIMGGGESGGTIDSFMKLSILEKVTGQDFLELTGRKEDKKEEKK